MIHLIYIYLVINSFIVGGYCNSSEYKFDSNWNRSFYIFFLVFFGGIIALLDFIPQKILDYFDYLTTEIEFQYRILLTDYFDNIYLDDSYSEDYDSREKKLKRTEELAQNSSKQRHNKQIQNKYGR
jgi:hypothetical protein